MISVTVLTDDTTLKVLSLYHTNTENQTDDSDLAATLYLEISPTHSDASSYPQPPKLCTEAVIAQVMRTWGPFHKSSYEQVLLYKFVEPVLNYRSNEFLALTNLCETGPCMLAH